jgi:hypothetical protein
MKNLLLLLLTTFALNSCSNNDDNKPNTPKTELEKLPPATHTGANTSGCLVNGKAFLPIGFIPGTNPISYQDDLNFVLFIGEKKNDIINSLGIFSLNKQLIEGLIIPLKLNLNDSSKTYAYGTYVDFSNGTGDYITTNMIIGELKITHHDFNNAILSGTFWFDAVNSNGEKVEVREGRFDRHY